MGIAVYWQALWLVCCVSEQHSDCDALQLAVCYRRSTMQHAGQHSTGQRSTAQRSTAVPADRVLGVSSCNQVQQKSLIWVHAGCRCEVQNTKLALLRHIHCIPQSSGTLVIASFIAATDCSYGRLTERVNMACTDPHPSAGSTQQAVSGLQL